MTEQEINNLINTGEKIDVEFKRAEKELNKDVYETVCSFNNRDGGDLFLGIEDKTKEIVSVDPDCVDKMIKNFTTSINNPQKNKSAVVFNSKVISGRNATSPIEWSYF